MTVFLRSALLAALVATSLPAIAQGQQSSPDSVARRIAQLERRVADLEQRVRELEGRAKAEPSRDRPAKPSGNWKEAPNWRRLRRGLSMDEVRALLGEPERVDATSMYTVWHWGDVMTIYAEAQFDSDGKLSGWSEPRR